MARTKTDADIQEFPVTEIVEKNTAELVVAMDANDIANAIVADKFELIKSIGRIETAQFYATVSEKLIVETALNVRQGKKYKGLSYKRENGESATVASFEEFCTAFLGKSVRRVQELMSNYNQLGPDLYEQAEKIGFRQRDYNALKALPEDDRQLIAQAIEEESLDKALDLMQEMAAKHYRDKETLTKTIKDQADTLEARNDVIKAKSDEINKKWEKIQLLENAQRNAITELDMPGEKRLMSLQDYARTITAKIEASLRSEIVQLLNEFDGQPPKHIQLAIAQSIGLIITAAYGVANDLAIAPQLDVDTAAEDPAKADAEEFLAWQQAQLAGE